MSERERLIQVALDAWTNGDAASASDEDRHYMGEVVDALGAELNGSVEDFRQRDRAWAMAVLFEGSEVAERICRKQIELREKHSTWLASEGNTDGARRVLQSDTP